MKPKKDDGKFTLDVPMEKLLAYAKQSELNALTMVDSLVGEGSLTPGEGRAVKRLSRKTIRDIDNQLRNLSSSST